MNAIAVIVETVEKNMEERRFIRSSCTENYRKSSVTDIKFTNWLMFTMLKVRTVENEKTI